MLEIAARAGLGVRLKTGRSRGPQGESLVKGQAAGKSSQVRVALRCRSPVPAELLQLMFDFDVILLQYV